MGSVNVPRFPRFLAHMHTGIVILANVLTTIVLRPLILLDVMNTAGDVPELDLDCTTLHDTFAVNNTHNSSVDKMLRKIRNLIGLARISSPAEEADL